MSKIILITGGTGSLGQQLTKTLLTDPDIKTIRIYSRGELLQRDMELRFNSPKLRFFIGDVRDEKRLSTAIKDVDIVIHTAALKHISACEYNPMEAIKTNILGTMNVIDCAIEQKVEKVIAISTDKAVQPINTYGKCKAVMENIIIQANVYTRKKTMFSCVRYGNVAGSRGSIIPLLQEQSIKGTLTVTDKRMTRFWITLNQGVEFVINCISMMRGGEIFVPKLPSFNIMDLIKSMNLDSNIKFIGIRPGEKLHEVLVSEDEARHTRDLGDYYVIHPEFPFWTEDQYWDMTGEMLPEGYRYDSKTNEKWIKTVGEKQWKSQ